MTKTIFGSISAVVLAALIAGTMTILPSFSDQVAASAPIHSGKGDRLDIRPLGSNCSEQAWPYFEAGCLRDQRSARGKAKTARIVAPTASSDQTKRWTARTALRPPNANEFDSAASTRIGRASLGTQSMSQAGSGPR